MAEEIMTAYTTNTTIKIDNQEDYDRIFNSKHMSEEAIKHFKDNQEKTKHIKIGNIYQNKEYQKEEYY